MAQETTLQAIWRTNRKVPIFLGVLLLLNLVFSFYLSLHLEKKAENLERHYINQQSEVRKAEQGGRSAESPLVVYARGIQDLKAFRNAIPDKSKLTGLVGEIFNLAESSGLQINRISYQPSQVKGMRLLQYGLDFFVVGDYNQIKKFAHKIEQSDRLVAIDQMTLNRTKRDDAVNVNLKLKLTTYFRMDAS